MNTDERIMHWLKKQNPKNPMGYLRSVAADYSIQKMNEAILNCKTCPCHNKRKSLPYGNPRGSILVVCENISTEQIENNPTDKEIYYPLVGSSGYDYLLKTFDFFKVNKNELMFINAVNCFTPMDDNSLKSRTPKKCETQECKTYVNYMMDIMNPCGILLLGSVAMNLWNIDSITKARGKFIFANRIPAMPTFHPDFLDRAAQFKSEDQVNEIRKQFFMDIGNFFEYFYKTYSFSNIFTEKPESSFEELKKMK